MARHFTEVRVTQQLHPQAILLVNGTATSNDVRIHTIACGKFNPNSRPVIGEKYDISALDNNDVRISLSVECTFSGETSEFRRL